LVKLGPQEIRRLEQASADARLTTAGALDLAA
jgi:hypothetical protein